MKHLLFDFNKVLLFPKQSIPVDLLMMLQTNVADLFFTHDTATIALAATQVGLHAHHYTTNEQLFIAIENF
jgi:peptide deformylase